MKADAVATAFEMLIEEVEAAADELKALMAVSAQNGDITSVKSCVEKFEKFAGFQVKLHDLLGEWRSSFSEDDGKARHIRAKQGKNGSRAPRTSLVVQMEDGRIIKENTAAATFCKVISEIGVDRVRSLGKIINNFPLVGIEKSEVYTQDVVGKYYVMTHTSTAAKRRLIEDIAENLGFKVRVSIAMDS